MSTKSPSIPAISGIDPSVAKVLAPLKETVENITGRRQGKLAKLAAAATAAEIAVKVNEIIDRLQS